MEDVSNALKALLLMTVDSAIRLIHSVESMSSQEDALNVKLDIIWTQKENVKNRNSDVTTFKEDAHLAELLSSIILRLSHVKLMDV